MDVYVLYAVLAKGRHLLFCEVRMRFLTKDWYLKYMQVEWIKSLRSEMDAKYFSEERYQRKYAEKEKQFVKNSQSDPLSEDHQSILKKVEKLIADPQVSEAEPSPWKTNREHP